MAWASLLKKGASRAIPGIGWGLSMLPEGVGEGSDVVPPDAFGKQPKQVINSAPINISGMARKKKATMDKKPAINIYGGSQRSAAEKPSETKSSMGGNRSGSGSGFTDTQRLAIGIGIAGLGGLFLSRLGSGRKTKTTNYWTNRLPS